MSSCCNGKCGCGSSCSCGSGCTGCGRNPVLSGETESTTTQVLILGVQQKGHFEDAEMGFEGANTCKCGPNCTCDPCNC